MKLHLGCGNDYKEGYVNCDVTNKVKVDQIVDLEKPLTMFKDNSVDEIVCNHVLEHIKNFIPLIEECFRICKNDAVLKIKVPYFAYPGAYADPTHVRFFTLKTFDYFSSNNDLNYYSNARFEIKKKYLNPFFKRKSRLLRYILNLFPSFYERFFSGIFGAAEIYFELECKKIKRIGE